MTIKLWPDDQEKAIALAVKGLSASQIIEELGLSVGVRQVQRIVAPYRKVKHCKTCTCWGME